MNTRREFVIGRVADTWKRDRAIYAACDMSCNNRAYSYPVLGFWIDNFGFPRRKFHIFHAPCARHHAPTQARRGLSIFISNAQSQPCIFARVTRVILSWITVRARPLAFLIRGESSERRSLQSCESVFIQSTYTLLLWALVCVMKVYATKRVWLLCALKWNQIHGTKNVVVSIELINSVVIEVNLP